MRLLRVCWLVMAFCLMAMPLEAVPAKRVWMLATLADGTQQEVLPCGDEFGHYFITADGQRLTMGSDGRLHGGSINDGIAAARRSSANQRRRSRKASASTNSYIGSKKGLILLVSFKGQQFANQSAAQSIWSRVANEVGYTNTYGRGCGSLHDYFFDQSYGQFDLTFDVVGPVALPHPYAYYGKNDENGVDVNVGQMVYEACVAVDSEVDFNRYDWNGDGEVEQVYLVYAGFGENEFSSTMPDLIWPHQSALDDMMLDTGPLYLDGVHVNTYACSNELMSGRQQAGIGTACHEFSHCLGLPDMYNTETGHGVLDTWDVMDHGNYNDNTWTPVAYSAYERYSCGWLTPYELNSGLTVTAMMPLTQQPQAFLVRNDAFNAGCDEYYLIENRQKEKWDAYLPGSGLLVWHVNYDAMQWWSNTVNNNPEQLGVAIIPAGGNRSSSSAAYPAVVKGALRNSLTDTSTPAAMVYNKNKNGRLFMGKPITNMDCQNGVASFVFMGGGSLAGDVNGDGHVDVGDIMTIINTMASIVPSAFAAGNIADVNGDGLVDVGDIMAIVNIMASTVPSAFAAGNNTSTVPSGFAAGNTAK